MNEKRQPVSPLARRALNRAQQDFDAEIRAILQEDAGAQGIDTSSAQFDMQSGEWVLADFDPTGSHGKPGR